MKISISFECTRFRASSNPTSKCHAYKDITQKDDRLDTISMNFVRQSEVLEHILKRLSRLEKAQTKSE